MTVHPMDLFPTWNRSMYSGNALQLHPERPRFTGIPELQANTGILGLPSSRSRPHSTHSYYSVRYFMTLHSNYMVPNGEMNYELERS
jgi:hypothetical protein